MFCFECFQFDIEMPRRYHLSNRCENPFLFHSPARCHCHHHQCHHHHHRQQHHHCHHVPKHWSRKVICDWIHLDLWAQEQWFQAEPPWENLPFLAKQAGDSSSDWLIGELVAGWQTVVEAKANWRVSGNQLEEARCAQSGSSSQGGSSQVEAIGSSGGGGGVNQSSNLHCFVQSNSFKRVSLNHLYTRSVLATCRNF